VQSTVSKALTSCTVSAAGTLCVAAAAALMLLSVPAPLPISPTLPPFGDCPNVYAQCAGPRWMSACGGACTQPVVHCLPAATKVNTRPRSDALERTELM